MSVFNDTLALHTGCIHAVHNTTAVGYTTHCTVTPLQCTVVCGYKAIVLVCQGQIACMLIMLIPDILELYH